MAKRNPIEEIDNALATIEVLRETFYRLRTELAPVSTGATTPRGKNKRIAESTARCLAARQKTILKNAGRK